MWARVSGSVAVRSSSGSRSYAAPETPRPPGVGQADVGIDALERDGIAGVGGPLGGIRDRTVEGEVGKAGAGVVHERPPGERDGGVSGDGAVLGAVDSRSPAPRNNENRRWR